MTKCLICDHRPAQMDSPFCFICQQQIDAELRRKAIAQPVKYLVYRGWVVGLCPSGKGLLSGRLLKRSPEKLPVRKVINLDKWCPGFDRQAVKAMKRCVLSLIGVH